MSAIWSEDGNTVTINTDPSFIAKTQLMQGNSVTMPLTTVIVNAGEFSDNDDGNSFRETTRDLFTSDR